MDSLVSVVSLQLQLATVAEKKRNLQATLHQFEMVELEQDLEAMKSPSSETSRERERVVTFKPPTAIKSRHDVPYQFVTLHIPLREPTNQNALKPNAENSSLTSEAADAVKLAGVMLPPPAGKRRKRSLTPRTFKPVNDTCGNENTQLQHVITPAQGGLDGQLTGPGSSKKSRVSLPLPLQIEQLRIEADRLHTNGYLVQAGEAYMSAINISGPWTERSMHASLHFNYAVCQIKQERYDEAIAHAGEAVKLEPTFAGAHYALGYAIGKGGKDLQLSMRSFKQVLKLKPNARVRLTNGVTFGSKEHPLLSEEYFLIVYQRKSCAHLTVPKTWTIRESRSQPGKIFFENLQTRATTWLVPQEKKKSFMSLNDILATSGGHAKRSLKKKGAAAFLTQNTN